jgi:hypothetical protein
MVVTAKPFATRDEALFLLEVRIPELEASEDIDPSLEAVSRPHAGGEPQPGCIRPGGTHWTQNFHLATGL